MLSSLLSYFRHHFGCSVVAFCCGLVSFATVCAEDDAKPWIRSEVGKLRKVIVHEPGSETHKAIPMFLGDHSMLSWELLRDEAVVQHRGFVQKLVEEGCEVLTFVALLKEAIEGARAKNELATWLDRFAPNCSRFAAELTPEMLLGRDPRVVYAAEGDEPFELVAKPATTLFFTRDLAVVTPRGVIIGNLYSERRQFEAEMTKFIFQHADSLRGYPIVYDAIEEDVMLQGGDVLVMNADTLLVGVGNATELRVAPELAKRLNLDVIAVQMPTRQMLQGEWRGLQNIYYHLDCLLNFTDIDKVLAVPYLLEEASVDANPMYSVLHGVARQQKRTRGERLAMLQELQDVGYIRRYLACSGEEDPASHGVKLLDYLRKQGYQVDYVGGPLPDQNHYQHVIEKVLRESRFMGANIVAVRPGTILSYDGLPHTTQGLIKSGVSVIDFPSNELVRANGGPHCLTLPLQRDSR